MAIPTDKKIKAVTYNGVNIPLEGGGGGGTFTNGVVFLDYDGTEVEKWDASTVAGKTALPDNPTHTGLVAQGWNWSLAKIKSYIYRQDRRTN